MKALSLWQPWASLVALGTKRIETRHWYLKHRGLLAIHAAQHVDKDACLQFGLYWNELPRGAVVCTVTVLDCVQFPHPAAPPDPFGNFEHGRYGFLLRLEKVFREPLPIRGRQGLFEVSL